MRDEFLEKTKLIMMEELSFFTDTMKAKVKENSFQKIYQVIPDKDICNKFDIHPFTLEIAVSKEHDLRVRKKSGSYHEVLADSFVFRNRTRYSYYYELLSHFYEAMEIARLTRRYLAWSKDDDVDEVFEQFLEDDLYEDEVYEILCCLHMMADMEGWWYRYIDILKSWAESHMI